MSLLPKNAKILEYKIVDYLGSGGFANTYLALDVNLNKKVAIKEFFPRRLCERREGDESYVVRPKADQEEAFRAYLGYFLQEAQILARFDERNIVKVLRYFEGMGTAFIIMEFVDGRDLGEYLKHNDVIEEDVVAEWLGGILKGLQVVHDNGLIHGDIKPRNIIIDTENQPVLIDFGASVIYQAMKANQGDNSELFLTQAYAAPEQFDNPESIDHRIDIFSLGAVFYEIVTREKFQQEEDGDASVILNYGKFYNAKYLRSIGTALEHNPGDRFGRAQDWLNFITLTRGQKFARAVKRHKYALIAAVVLIGAATGLAQYLIEQEVDLKNYRYKLFASADEVRAKVEMGDSLIAKIAGAEDYLKSYMFEYRSHTARIAANSLISGRNNKPELLAGLSEVDGIVRALRTIRDDIRHAARKYYFMDYRSEVAGADRIVKQAEAKLVSLNTRLLAAMVENEIVVRSRGRRSGVRKADLAAMVGRIRDDPARFQLGDVVRRTPPLVEGFLREQRRKDEMAALEAFRAKAVREVGELQRLHRRNRRSADLGATLERISRAENSKEIAALRGQADRIVALIQEDRRKAVRKQRRMRRENAIRAVIKDTEAAMIRVDGGSFQMGSNQHAYAMPPHFVNINPFFISANEVTVRQWNMCVEDKRCRPVKSILGGDYPVTGVSWVDARTYVSWVNRKKTRYRFRLVSESEWEFVVKKYGFRMKELSSGLEAVSVDNRNKGGINSIVGNALEWLDDCWHGGYFGAPVDGRSWRTGLQCDRRVVRGSNWNGAYPIDEDNVHFFRPFGLVKTERKDTLGFRLAGDLR